MVVDCNAAHSRAKDVEHTRNGRREAASSDDVAKYVWVGCQSSRWSI